MAPQEFGERVHDDVRAVLNWSQQDRRSHRVIHDERYVVVVGYLRQLFDVADVPCRIADAFAKDRSRVAVEQLGDCLRTVALREADGDSLTRQDVCEQRMRGAVKLRDGDDVAAHLRDVLDGVVHGCLAAADAKSLQSTLESGNAPFQHCYGRVLDAGVAISLDLKVKERGSMVGAVKRMETVW